MKILAFDIASSTGIAFGGPGDVPMTKVIDLGRARSKQARFAKAIRMTAGFIEARRPDLVAVECPIGPGTSSVLSGAYACVVGQAHLMGVRVVDYQVQSIRKHFLGKALTSRDFPGLTKDESRAEIKRVVMNRCRALGWKVDTDDEADACALWDYAMAKAGVQTVPQGGLF